MREPQDTGAESDSNAGNDAPPLMMKSRPFADGSVTASIQDTPPTSPTAGYALTYSVCEQLRDVSLPRSAGT